MADLSPAAPWKHYPMINQQHPITPPPELVQQWRNEEPYEGLLSRAAQYGADQELEACIDWISAWHGLEHPELLIELLRAARRPKPPSLKEQALAVLEEEPEDAKELIVFDVDQVKIIRRALEALND
jgi:hypothetical protein